MRKSSVTHSGQLLVRAAIIVIKTPKVYDLNSFKLAYSHWASFCIHIAIRCWCYFCVTQRSVSVTFKDESSVFRGYLINIKTNISFVRCFFFFWVFVCLSFCRWFCVSCFYFSFLCAVCALRRVCLCAIYWWWPIGVYYIMLKLQRYLPSIDLRYMISRLFRSHMNFSFEQPQQQLSAAL